MKRRREFITLLGGAAVWPVAAPAQQPAMTVVGFLSNGSLEGFSPYLATFRRGLGEVGFVEGRNVAIEYRWADNDNERLQGMAADLLRARASVIVAPTLPAALAMKSATASVPIVFCRRKSGRFRPRQQLQSPGRQPHGRERIGNRTRCEAN